MAGQSVPSTADATGKITRSQSLKKTSTCLEDTLMFPGVRVFFWWGSGEGGGGGAALFLLLLIINRRLTETRTYSACIPLFYSGIKSLLQLNIANLDATRSFVFVLKSRFCKWRALISQHFCQAFSQKTK